MPTSTPFEIVFNVEMTCQSCAESIGKAISPLVSSYDCDVKNNTVTTTGGVAPSEIVKAIQSTGRDAIIRGTGKPNSAAVCILESFDPKDNDHPVKGLARIVSVSTSDLFIDLTINGLPKGVYYPSIRSVGNLLRGPLSTGLLFYQLSPIEVMVPSDETSIINSIGAPMVVDGFSGQLFLHANLGITDLIGRLIVVSRAHDLITEDALCGVIARLAGVWENDKTVCSCSGKTVWEERQDARGRGIN